MVKRMEGMMYGEENGFQQVENCLVSDGQVLSPMVRCLDKLFALGWDNLGCSYDVFRHLLCIKGYSSLVVSCFTISCRYTLWWFYS